MTYGHLSKIGLHYLYFSLIKKLIFIFRMKSNEDVSSIVKSVCKLWECETLISPPKEDYLLEIKKKIKDSETSIEDLLKYMEELEEVSFCQLI